MGGIPPDGKRRRTSSNEDGSYPPGQGDGLDTSFGEAKDEQKEKVGDATDDEEKMVLLLLYHNHI